MNFIKNKMTLNYYNTEKKIRKEQEKVVLTHQFRNQTISNNVTIFKNFKSIYGMNWFKTECILNRLGYSINSSFLDILNEYDKYILFYYLNIYIMTEDNIKRFPELQIKKLIELKTYKGSRHKLCLPVHGQRTRTNANTQKSKRDSNIKIDISNINANSIKYKKNN
jgi:small subunit ribosomal protein S13